MDATTTVIWFRSTQIYVYQNLLIRTQTKRYWNKWNSRENLWVKPYVGLIKIKFHSSDAHFDDQSITFGVASCIMVQDPSFRMTLLFEISCWNHISDFHTVLDPYELTCWQLIPHYTDVLSWVAIFNLVVNEKEFSVPFERHILLKSHDIILRVSFHWCR